MTSTLIRKYLMALTGLFLCLFLVIHLAGNLQLLLPPERASAQFNLYSRILSGNILIKVISWVLFASIIAHSVYALLITLQNRKAAGSRYAYDKRQAASNWASRNMGFLGTVLFVFLVIHLGDFWFEYSFTEVPKDANGNKDLFSIVVRSYGQPWYIALNLLAFLALGFHLYHGFQSAFKTLGAFPTRLSRILYYAGVGFTIIMTLGFSIIPLFVYFQYHY